MKINRDVKAFLLANAESGEENFENNYVISAALFFII